MRYLNKKQKKQKKVLFVATVVKKHIMEFHIPYLKMFKEMGWETAVAAKNDYENPADCVIPYCDCYYDIPFERSPLKARNVEAYLNLKRLINTENYDIVHCHTPVGGILARFASRNARKKGLKVIYTAHGFHFYKGAPLLNWMLFYPVEWLCSWWTDVLITINKEDYMRAKKRFHAKRTEYVHGVGIDVNKFRNGLINIEEKRKSLNLHEDDIMLLSVGELNKNKNHFVVIQALAEMNNYHIHYFIAGSGKLKGKLEQLSEKLGIEKQIHFLGYRNDIVQLLKIADIFILPSRREGLNVSLMEAMASGLPCIVSKIRGNLDLIVNDKCLVKADSVVGWRWAIDDMLNCIHNRKISYMEEGNKRIQRYEISIVSKHVRNIYQSVMTME